MDKLVVTITTSTGEVFTFQEGDVESIQSNIGVDLDFDSMPNSTANDAMLFDFNGVKKVIRVSGQLSDAPSSRSSVSSVTDIFEQREWLEKALNGNQSGALFDSNYTSTYNGTGFFVSAVLFSNVVFTENVGNPNNLPFEITLFVGAV